MRGSCRLLPVIALLLPLTVLGEEQNPPVQVSRLTETLYQLTTDQGNYTTNTLASVGVDGVLLVDTQASEDAEALRKTVDAFGKGIPRIIINTHSHVEHVGGNAIFGEEPVVISHETARNRLRSGSYLFDEFGDETLADITFRNEMRLHFNGEEIRLIAMPGSHDDNEIIVHFTGSKVVHLSSLVNGFNFPSVDSHGSALAFAGLVGKAIDLLPEDVVIVSGHNENGTWKDLVAYREMLIASTEIVREGLAAGKDADTLKQENVLEPWASYAGSYVSVDRWIDYLVSDLEGKEAKKDIYEPLYYSVKENGAEAAVALYREMKRDQADEYDFRHTDLLIIGDKLLDRGLVGPAMSFLEASLQEYPASAYAYYAHFLLARAHHRRGDREAALDECRKALELSPDNETVVSLLKELEAGEAGGP